MDILVVVLFGVLLGVPVVPYNTSGIKVPPPRIKKTLCKDSSWELLSPKRLKIK